MNHIFLSETQLNWLVYSVLVVVLLTAALIFHRVSPTSKPYSDKTMANFALVLMASAIFNILMAVYLIGYSTVDTKYFLLIATVLSFYIGAVFFMYASPHLYQSKSSANTREGIVY